MEPRSLVRADLVTGAVLVALGVAVVVLSWNMPRLEERNVAIWTVPGLVPGLLGIVIGLLGAALALRSVAAADLAGEADAAEPAEERAGMARLLACAALCLVYATVLIGRISFEIATGLFVFAFVAFFEWNRGDAPGRRGLKLAVAAAIAVAAAAGISLLFERLFLVRLP
ncbi:MAG TPA: tripartite tricarboxylate transporter TctB family protein [Beijerinckiaceae bacterium]|nr:tripartite tricarboxylate transporter TctB family protein [Beijerinckiaceae bacterium]